MQKWQQTSSGLLVPCEQVRDKPVAAVDLFAGCGGFSLGLHQSGIDVVAAVEWNVEAAMARPRRPWEARATCEVSHSTRPSSGRPEHGT